MSETSVVERLARKWAKRVADAANEPSGALDADNVARWFMEEIADALAAHGLAHDDEGVFIPAIDFLRTAATPTEDE